MGVLGERPERGAELAGLDPVLDRLGMAAVDGQVGGRACVQLGALAAGAKRTETVAGPLPGGEDRVAPADEHETQPTSEGRERT